MGLLDRFRAKQAARKEKAEQVYLNSRPARLAALQKEKALFEKKREERNLVKQVQALKAEERKEKYKPLTKALSSLKSVAQQGAKLSKQAANKQGLPKSANLAEQRRNALFGTPQKKDLFEVKDWRK